MTKPECEHYFGLWDIGVVCEKCGETKAQILARRFQDARNVVVGWREYDWPEGFDRFTAELIAERFKGALGDGEDYDSVHNS